MMLLSQRMRKQRGKGGRERKGILLTTPPCYPCCLQLVPPTIFLFHFNSEHKQWDALYGLYGMIHNLLVMWDDYISLFVTPLVYLPIMFGSHCLLFA